MEELWKNPDINRTVGHSLAGAVAREINRRSGNRYATTVYSSPLISGAHQPKHPRNLKFRNRGDVIAAFDDAAITGEIERPNLLDKHGYQN